jgi:L-rhamnonate dehydratase
MKIAAIDLLTLNLPPLASPTPPRPIKKPARGLPLPIHAYPEFARTSPRHPGDVVGELWVRIVAEDGTFGLGHTHWSEFAAPVVRFAFEPLLVGRDCLAIEFLNDLMWRTAQRFGPAGISSLAMGAVDMALWDLKGKLLGVPVYSLIGGPCRTSVEYYVTTKDLDWGMELGFKAFKIPNTALYLDGTEGINRLEESVAEAREKVGPDADLMINPVMSYNVEYAIRVMERLLPYRLRWFEEPLMPYDTDGLVRLKRAVPTLPIATGEDHKGRHAFRELIDRRCVDVLQPDLRWSGGLSEVLKIYTLGEAAGLQTIVHGGGMMAAGQHFAFAMPESPLTEWIVSSPAGVPLEEVSRIPGLPIPKDGRVVPSNAPGFGYELRPEHFQPWTSGAPSGNARAN